MLAGRVALALDNAGLSSEVEALEAQLSAGPGSLAEAVTIQDRQGRLVYANEAAERALGFATTEELLATPPQEIVDAYDSFHGVVDAVGEAGRFGERRLAEALRGARGATGVVAGIDAALRAFERGEQADDTAVLAVERLS